MTEHNSAECTQDTSTRRNFWQGCHTRNEESEGKLLGGCWRGATVPHEDVTNIYEHFRFPMGSFSVFLMFTLAFLAR